MAVDVFPCCGFVFEEFSYIPFLLLFSSSSLLFTLLSTSFCFEDTTLFLGRIGLFGDLAYVRTTRMYAASEQWRHDGTGLPINSCLSFIEENGYACLEGVLSDVL